MLDRAAFLRRTAGLAAAGLTLAPAARAATPITPVGDDLGLLQFTATAKLVALAFADRALRAHGFDAGERRRLALVRAGDAEHLEKLRFTLNEQAPKQADFQITLPERAFASRTATAHLGERLESLTLGVGLLGAAVGQDSGTRALLARILAADAAHLAGYRVLRGAPAAPLGLPEVPDFEQSAAALDVYLEPST